MYKFPKSKGKAKFTAVYCGDSECYSKYSFGFVSLTHAKVMLRDLDVCRLNMVSLKNVIQTSVLPTSLSGWLVGWLGFAREVQGSMPKVQFMCAMPCGTTSVLLEN